MQRELEKKVETMTRKVEFSEDEERWELKEEDIQQTLQDVLNEVYSKRNDNKMVNKD
jgi:Lon protease-like protein